MKLQSVNIGSERVLDLGTREVKTGIHKKPVTERVQITDQGLEGDRVVDTRHHGGPDQAVYVYTTDDYDAWVARLGEALEPGTFGENLTVSGLESASLKIGDRLHIGPDVILEVTSPRIPCNVLAARMGDTGFVKTFKSFERPGAYCRVIQTGSVGAGDTVRLEPCEHETIGVIDDFRLYYNAEATASDIKRSLNAPIAIRTRQELQERLEKLEPRL
jgi:MOSC domain-containing protein YiiM